VISPKKILLFCASVVLAVGVAACGSQSSDTTSQDTGTDTATTKTTTSKTTTSKTTTSKATTSETTGAAETTSESAEAAGPTITITGMSFGAPITVAPGAEVTVKNDDSAEHSVTSDKPDAFDEHIDAGESDTFTAPTEPGEYTFYCTYHPSMKGTLIVQ
jgi:plastocyanin